MNVVIRRESVAAKGVQCLRHGAARRIGVPPGRQGNLGPRSRGSIGNVANGLPREVFTAVHVTDEISERMRDSLIGSDRLSESHRRNQQLPFLDRLLEAAYAFPARGKHGPRSRAETQLGDGRRGEIGLTSGLVLAQSEQDDLITGACNNRLGYRTPDDPLSGLADDIFESDTDDRAARDDLFQPGRAGPLSTPFHSQLRKQPGDHDGFGDRAGCQRTPDLLHQEDRIQQTEPQSAASLRNPQRECAELCQSRP